MYFESFIFYCEKYFNIDAGRHGRARCDINAGRVNETDKNKRFADYEMQMQLFLFFVQLS